MTTAFFSHDDCAKHDMGADHPESPERLSRIISYIKDTDLADQLDWVRPEEATRDQLLLVHPEKYLHQLDLMQPAKGRVFTDPDTALMQHTLRAARLAAGAETVGRSHPLPATLLAREAKQGLATRIWQTAGWPNQGLTSFAGSVEYAFLAGRWGRAKARSQQARRSTPQVKCEDDGSRSLTIDQVIHVGACRREGEKSHPIEASDSSRGQL